MAIAVRSTSTSGSGDVFQTSNTTAVPTGAAIGDIAILCVEQWTSAPERTATFPAGFTEITGAHTSLSTSIEDTGTQTIRMAWKRLTAADTGTYGVSYSGQTWNLVHCVMLSGGLATGDPIEDVDTATATSGYPSTSVTAATLAAIVNSAGTAGSRTTTPPTSFTEQRDTSTLHTNTRILTGAATVTASGGTVSSATEMAVAMIAVKPADAGGGTDATATPAAVVSTVVVPQATPSTGSTKTPAATTVTVAAPQATPAVTDTASPATTSTVVALPQAAAAGDAVARPATIVAVVAIPRTAVSVATGPATLTATVALPGATPQTAGNATVAPVAVSAVIVVPAASRSGAAAASPATLAAVAALPSASPLAGGNVTASPAPVSVAAGVPAALPQAGVVVSPGVVVTVVSVPRPAVGTAVGPASIAVLTTFPAAAASTTSSVTRTPATVAATIVVPHASAFAEGAGLRGRLGELSAHLPGGIVAPGTFDSGGTIR